MADGADTEEPPKSSIGIVFTDDAIDDLRRIGPDAARRAVVKLGILRTDVHAGRPLGGELTGYRKLVVGDRTWRIVYRVDEAKTVVVCEIWAIGNRADSEVYREAKKRIAAARGSSPELTALSAVLESLGRQARGLEAADGAKQPEVVPDWLAGRLVEAVGLPPAIVAALTLQEAVACWEDFLGRPR